MHACFVFGNLVGFTTLRSSFLKPGEFLGPFLARHCRLHWNSQLSSCVFDGFFIFTIFRIDEINASQPSSIVEFGFLFCPFLLLFPLSGCSNFGPYFWSGSSLNFSFSRVDFVMPFNESDKCLLESTFQQSSTQFSCNRPDLYE